MDVFICDNSFDGVLSAVYDAWSTALKIGHDNVRITKEQPYPSLFDNYIYVAADADKADKVIRSIKNRISSKALYWVYSSARSCEADTPDAIYRFLIKGFKVGSVVTEMLAEPEVIRLMKINKRVGGEAHHYIEFARFNLVGNAYISHLEPDNDVIFDVAEFFADRMPSEHFMIIDDNRKTAAVHPKDEEVYIRKLSNEEFMRLSASETFEDEYTSMWRTFFDTIAIKERMNIRCQNNLFPKKKRKHATEFM